MENTKVPYENLEQNYFDYLYFVTQPGLNINDREKLHTDWITTLTDNGWTEQEFNEEHSKLYS